MRISSSVEVSGWIRDGRDPLSHFIIHHSLCSMLLRFIPSIRKMFIAAVEAGLGPANLVKRRWDVKISCSVYRCMVQSQSI